MILVCGEPGASRPILGHPQSAAARSLVTASPRPSPPSLGSIDRPTCQVGRDALCSFQQAFPKAAKFHDRLSRAKAQRLAPQVTLGWALVIEVFQWSGGAKVCKDMVTPL